MLRRWRTRAGPSDAQWRPVRGAAKGRGGPCDDETRADVRGEPRSNGSLMPMMRRAPICVLAIASFCARHRAADSNRDAAPAVTATTPSASKALEPAYETSGWIYPESKDALSKATPETLFAKAEGVMIGRGELWFGRVCTDPDRLSHDIKVIASNPPIPPALRKETGGGGEWGTTRTLAFTPRRPSAPPRCRARGD